MRVSAQVWKAMELAFAKALQRLMLVVLCLEGIVAHSPLFKLLAVRVVARHSKFIAIAFFTTLAIAPGAKSAERHGNIRRVPRVVGVQRRRQRRA